MFLAFSVLGVVWTAMVIRGKQDSHKIHYLMIVLVAFKSLTVLSQVGIGWAGGCLAPPGAMPIFKVLAAL